MVLWSPNLLPNNPTRGHQKFHKSNPEYESRPSQRDRATPASCVHRVVFAQCDELATVELYVEGSMRKVFPVCGF